MVKDIAKAFYYFLKNLGIEPIYVFTILIILIHIVFDHKKYKNWDKLPDGEKFYFVIGILAAIILIIISFLRMIGVFDNAAKH